MTAGVVLFMRASPPKPPEASSKGQGWQAHLICFKYACFPDQLGTNPADSRCIFSSVCLVWGDHSFSPRELLVCGEGSLEGEAYQTPLVPKLQIVTSFTFLAFTTRHTFLHAFAFCPVLAGPLGSNLCLCLILWQFCDSRHGRTPLDFACGASTETQRQFPLHGGVICSTLTS